MSSSDDKQSKRKVADGEEKEWDDERGMSMYCRLRVEPYCFDALMLKTV